MRSHRVLAPLAFVATAAVAGTVAVPAQHILGSRTHRNAGHWHRLAPLPVPHGAAGVLGLAAAASRGSIYAIGGVASTSAEPTRDVWRYDPAADRWTRRAPLPVGVADAAAVALPDGHILVMGGEQQLVSAAVQEYNPARDRWTLRPPLPARRAYAAAARLGHHVYVIGGRGGDYEPYAGPARQVFVYDTRLRTWRRGPNLPRALYGAHALDYAGRILVLGGYSARNPAELRTTYVLAHGRWRLDRKLRLPLLRSGGAVCGPIAVVGSRLFQVGGGSGAGAPMSVIGATDRVLVLDLETGGSSHAARLPRRAGRPGLRTQGAAVALDGRVYALGGYDPHGNAYLRSVYALDP